MTDHTTAPATAHSTANPGERRVLLVHAHPDDESIATGATMAQLAAEGAQVVLSPARAERRARSSSRI